MHHLLQLQIISVSLVTELISDRDRPKHALLSKISFFHFFTDSYSKSLTIFRSSGKSSDDERKVEPISLGDCPVPGPKKTSAVHSGTQLCWLLMLLRGVARIFSEVRSTHQMPLFHLPPTTHQYPQRQSYCKPKRFTVYELTSLSHLKNFMSLFLVRWLKQVNHFHNSRQRLQLHRDAWIQKITNVPAWLSFWRFWIRNRRWILVSNYLWFRNFL